MSAAGRSPGRLAVFVASRFLEEVRSDFAAAFDAGFAATSEPLRELASSERAHDALIVSLDVPLRRDAIETLPSSIRAIATYSVGTDHIDLEAAAGRGIAVFNTPGVLSDSVAENAFLLMLGAARRATESIDLVRSGRWTGWSPTQLVGVELAGKRLGILGMGDIGERVAVRARAFGMEIAYCNRAPRSGLAFEATFVESPAALAASSDVLLLACPSTPETRGVVDATLLAEARPGLLLVNVARGDLVDDRALIDALRSGRIRAAGLDVFAGEPAIEPDYFALPNVFMLPHIGSSTEEARRRMGQILVAALETWAAGGEPPNRVR